MFPLKDTLPTERRPRVTVTLVVLAILAIWLWDAPAVPSVLAAWALWIAGRSLEDAAGPLALLVFCAALASGAAAVAGAPAAPVAAAAGAVGAYVRLRPRGRIQTLILIPVLAGLVEAPATILAACWVLLQMGLSQTDLGDGIAVWLPPAAALIGAAVLAIMRPRPSPAG